MRPVFFIFILWAQVAYGAQNTWPTAETWLPQIVRWQLSEHKELIFIATHHVNNFHSSTHQQIKEIFEKEKPDIYIMEGFCSDREGLSPERLKNKSTKIVEQVGRCGENLYGAYLATYNIPFKGAEISEKVQLALLQEKGYTREDVIFYLLVQQLTYFYRDGDFKTHFQKFTPATWEPMCNDFLQQIIAEWIDEEVTLTYQDFLVWWQRRFKSSLDMEKEFLVWERGVFYCNPSQAKDALYTQKIAFWFHKNRDDHLFKIIRDAVRENKKVLDIHGSHHLRALWFQLVQAYGKPSSVIPIALQKSEGKD